MTSRAAGRGGLAAGAGADEQHADGDARPAARARRRRTTRRCRSGRRLLRRAGRPPGRSGSGSHGVVVRSSAVPVLPATRTPRDRRRARRCRRATTARIIRSTVARDARRRDARASRAASPPSCEVERAAGRRAAQRDRRGDDRPSAARWPARGPGRSPTSRPRGRRRSRRPAGSCSSPRRRCRRGRLKPKRSATSTSRSAPSSAPSGAKTELHDWAKDVDERAAARLAVGVLELDALERRRRLRRDTRVRRLGDARPRSAPVERDDLERRARAAGGRRSAMPASGEDLAGARVASPRRRRGGRRARRPPRAGRSGAIVVRTALGAPAARVRASTRSPAQQLAAGPAAQARRRRRARGR